MSGKRKSEVRKKKKKEERKCGFSFVWREKRRHSSWRWVQEGSIDWWVVDKKVDTWRKKEWSNPIFLQQYNELNSLEKA
jgi:hypothetical protein